jgi:hypothetical protein
MRSRISLGKGFFPLLFSSLLILLCLAGCVQDSNISDNGQSQQLEFSVTTHRWDNSDKSSNQKIPSRATPISTFDTSKSFNVIADVNNEGNWTTEVNNETASYSTENKIWQTSNIHYWPGSGSNIDFYAYYPTNISGSITHNTGSAPVLSYIVPDNATDQIDILASSKTGVAGDSYNQTPVDFKHILAAVQFCVGSSGMINGTITKISLNGILNTGSYSFASGWMPQTSSTTTYTKDVSAASNAGTEIVSGNDPFLVMPQTLSNASFTVTYSGGATLTKSLSGIWEAGKVYDYNINSSFSATQDFSYTGNVQSYTVPFTGTYKLEVWGAEGGYGWDMTAGGKGGYSAGDARLSKGQIIYVVVGGAGNPGSNHTQVSGYNGGGESSLHVGPDGGGATHIAITNRGILSNYQNYQNDILIVAGGGGGSERNMGGDGGGASGTLGSIGWICSWDSGLLLTAAGSGTQTSGGIAGTTSDKGNAESGTFGKGGNGYVSGSQDAGGAGGGGWYGGGGIAWYGGGGGGSGHLGSNLISGTTNMQNGVRLGDGYARITFISAN